MRRNIIMLLAAALLVVTGCKKDDKTAEGEKMTFNAGFDNGSAKTEINDLDMSWNKGDAVMINGKTFTADQSGRNTTLSGEKTYQEGGLYKAYFPASMYDNGTLTLPATQTYNGTNLSGVNPMYAQSDDTNLTFSNLCALVKIQLNGSDKTVKEIRISADQPLSGEFEIGEFELSSGITAFKAVMKDEMSAADVTLSCGTGVCLSTNNIFYMALPEGNYTYLRFLISTTDNYRASFMIESATLHANKLYEVVRDPNFHRPASVTPSTINVCTTCIYDISGRVKVSTGSQACEFGIVYSETDKTPTIEEGAKTIVAHTFLDEPISGTVDFNVDLAAMTAGVTYYVRAYAICDNVRYENDDQVKIVYAGDEPQPLPSNWAGGRSPYPFTIADPDGTPNSGDELKVYFSQGNLQYKAEGASESVQLGENVGGTWRFALHQFDYVGDDTRGNVFENGEKCNNKLISSTYAGWIDLFGWGCSGYNHNNKAYMPWSSFAESTNVNAKKYYAYGNKTYNLYDGTGDAKGKADWGVANTISNGEGYNWRTLKIEEWKYLVDIRKGSDGKQLAGDGRIGNCIPGCIILPDNWVLPEGLSFVPGHDRDYKTNRYSYMEWSRMEAAGAIFLPLCGQRSGSRVGQVDEQGSYWSTTRDTFEFENDPVRYYSNWFTSRTGNNNYGFNEQYSHVGNAVRLVTEIVNP